MRSPRAISASPSPFHLRTTHAGRKSAWRRKAVKCCYRGYSTESAAQNQVLCLRNVPDIASYFRVMPAASYIKRPVFDPAVPRLFIIDNSKALAWAIRRSFGRNAAIQRCQIHKPPNIMERLPKPRPPCTAPSLGA